MQTLIILFLFIQFHRPLLLLRTWRNGYVVFIYFISIPLHMNYTVVHLSSKVKSVDICYNIKFHLRFSFLFLELVAFIYLSWRRTDRRKERRNVCVCNDAGWKRPLRSQRTFTFGRKWKLLFSSCMQFLTA